MNYKDLDLKNFKLEVNEKDGTVFPSKSYTKIELKPAYDNAKENFLDIMINLNKAQVIMLMEQGIISKEDGEKIKDGIRNLKVDELRNSEYSGEYEDLFFRVEDNIVKLAGESGGNLHIGRSRNDLSIAIYRIAIRERLLNLIESATNVHIALLAFSKEHMDTLMIAHTHTQQAQPSTLGHYMQGASNVIARDINRLKNAYENVNRSPLGAAAITTSGYDMNRERLRELSGFSEIVDNSYDCIGGGDYQGETATSIMLSAIDLGRIINDMLLWSTNEMNVLKVAPPYIQISSIMPQKRNPVSIEHMRALLSAVIGQCNTVLTMLHNTPYGDINDTEDDMQPFTWKALDLMDLIYNLFYSVISTMEVNKKVLRDRAENSLAVVTELADTLTREEKITFSNSHKIASNLVNKCLEENLNRKDIKFNDINTIFKDIIGRDINTDEKIIMNSLDPDYFVKIRDIHGGPAKSSMEILIKQSLEKYNENINWLEEQNKKLGESFDELEKSFNK